MAATADAIDSRAYRVAPTQRRGEALLLVGPAVLYLIAFSVYPLVTSLIRSFESLTGVKISDLMARVPVLGGPPTPQVEPPASNGEPR